MFTFGGRCSFNSSSVTPSDPFKENCFRPPNQDSSNFWPQNGTNTPFCFGTPSWTNTPFRFGSPSWTNTPSHFAQQSWTNTPSHFGPPSWANTPFRFGPPSWTDPAVIQMKEQFRDLKETKSARLFHDKLREIIESMKRNSRSVGDHDWSYDVRVLLSQCFERELDDSDAISGVLSFLENASAVGTIERVLQNLIYYRTASLSRDADGALFHSPCFGTYLLRHANKSELKLHGERLVSLLGLTRPSLSSRETLMQKPASALTVLQFGGRLSDRETISRQYIPEILVHILWSLIHYGGDEHLWDTETLELQQDLSKMTIEVKNLCRGFSTMLMDTLNPQEATFYLAGHEGSYFRIPELGKMLPFYDKVFPGHLYGRRNPSSLSHMCRYCIRKALYDNWKLPDGIQSLPIPVVIKNYLNLLHD